MTSPEPSGAPAAVAAPGQMGEGAAELARTELEAVIAELRAEVSALRARQVEADAERDQLAEVVRAKRDVEHQLVALRATLRDRDIRIAAIEADRAFLVARTVSDWMGARQRAIAALASKWRRRLRPATRPERARAVERTPKAPVAAQTFNEAVFRLQRHGLEDALGWVRRQPVADGELARILFEFARLVRGDDRPSATALLREAASLDRTNPRARLFAFSLFDDGVIEEASSLLQAVEATGPPPSPSETRRAAQIVAAERLRAGNLQLPERRVRSGGSGPARVLICSTQSLPYHKSPSALRAQDTARYLHAIGIEAEIVCPPGYPNKGGWEAAQRTVDGVVTRYLPPIAALPEEVDAFGAETGRQIAHLCETVRPSLILGEWSPALAIGAASAARLLGLPFALDVADIWTPAQPSLLGWETTERFQTEIDLCVRMAKAADAVLTRESGLDALLRERGIEAARVRSAADVVSVPENPRLNEAALRAELGLGDATVLGYVGTAYPFLDLDALVQVCADLVRDGRDVKLLVVGASRRVETLAALALRLGIGDRVVAVTRPTGNDIGRYNACVDIAVMPARVSRVTTFKSPTELWQAAAYGAAPVATGGVAFRDVIEPGQCGLIYDPSDLLGCRGAITALLSDPARLADMRVAAHRRAVDAAASTRSALQEMSGAFA